SPTIDPAQTLRAAFVVVAASLPLVQTGSPSVTTAPCLSNQTVRVCRIGGSEPSVVPIRPSPCSVIGAVLCFGSVVGEKPPSPTTSIGPARNTIASAAPPIANKAITVRTDVLNTFFRIGSLLP